MGPCTRKLNAPNLLRRQHALVNKKLVVLEQLADEVLLLLLGQFVEFDFPPG